MKQRLHKILASAGIASLRKSEQLIAEGRVQVNGKTAVIGDFADPDTDDIVADGNQVAAQQKRYLLLNKPTGYVTTVTDPHGRPTVMDLVDVYERVYPVGRLDVDTAGLLLLTNDGDFSQKMTHPSYEIEKTYLAELARPLTEEGQALLERGIKLDDGPTAPAKITIVSRRRRRIEITIHEGRNRIVRRMLDSVDAPVVKLRRIKFGTLSLDDVPKGTARDLTFKEVESLMSLTTESKRDGRRGYWRRRGASQARGKRRPVGASRTSGSQGSAGRRKSPGRKPAGSSRRSRSRS